MRNRSVWVLAALAGATGLMLVADEAQAQRRGGSGFGISVGRGGISFGTGGGGWGYGGSGWGYGGYGRGGIGYGSGLGYGRGYYNPGFGISVGSGLRSSFYGPSYHGGSYYSSPYYGGSYYGGSYGTPYYGGSTYYSGSPSGTYSDGSYESSEPMGSLKVQVHVPHPNARVTFNGVTSTTNSTVRHFETSSMAPGRPYNFQVEAVWTEGGREMRQTRNITGYAGQSLDVNFAGAAGTTGTDTDRTPGLVPAADPGRTLPKTGIDRTPGVSKDLPPGTAPGSTTDRIPVVPDRTPTVPDRTPESGGSDRIRPDIDIPDRR